jgi:hypothetical protein
MLDIAWPPANDQHGVNIWMFEAFKKDTLADHARGSKKNCPDFHHSPFVDRTI